MSARGTGGGKTRGVRIPVYSQQFHTIARSHEEEIPNWMAHVSAPFVMPRLQRYFAHKKPPPHWTLQ